MKPEAQLVYDGHELHIPAQCGEPAPGQMAGTVAERLAELAGRECYDSLGNGRDSVSFHRHILEVGHFSIYEHCNSTIEVRHHNLTDALLSLTNRPGVYVRYSWGSLRVTLNIRCLLDWSKWENANGVRERLPVPLRDRLVELAPFVSCGVTETGSSVFDSAWTVPPADDEERWITLRLTGSRGFSHELVRHGDRTAISQRSTRYVDENESPWCLHPLVRSLREDHLRNRGWSEKTDQLIALSRELYADTVALGSTELVARGVDKGTARKQSRGAARGFLGNALGTSVIFSASVAQWRRMLVMRCHPAADAEIRESAAEVLRVLKTSNYSDRFADMMLVPSPDGLGEVLA